MLFVCLFFISRQVAPRSGLADLRQRPSHDAARTPLPDPGISPPDLHRLFTQRPGGEMAGRTQRYYKKGAGGAGRTGGEEWQLAG